LKLKKIITLLLAIIILCSLLFVGCGNKSENASTSKNGVNKPVTVTFWAAAVTEDRKKFFDWFASYVHQVYPDITLDVVAVPGDLKDYRQKLDVAIQAGTAPDITNDFRPELITNGYYQNLNDFFNNWKDKDKINEQLIKSNKTYDPKGTGLYALPYSSQTWNMWIRTDWLKEAGLDVPKNWDDFFTDIKILTKPNEGRYGLAIRGGAGSANTLEMLMYSYSGITHYFNKDGTSTINDPKNVEFVQKYLVDSYNKYTAQDDLTKGWTELANAFQSGKAGIIFHNLGSASSMVTAFNSDYSKFQAAIFPASIKGYVVHPALMPLGLSMNSKSKNKDAVWKVMTLYVSKEVNTRYCKLYGEIPANKDAAQDSFFTNSPYMKVGVEILTSSNIKFNDTPYYLPTYTNIQSDMEPNIQAVMSGKMKPKELLDLWAKALEEAYKDYNQSVKK
jgi:multiple sugar transport system substrate-binding protein